MSNEEKDTIAPGVGPAWQVVEVRADRLEARVVLASCEVNDTLVGNMRAFMHREFPVYVSTCPTAPTTDERAAFTKIRNDAFIAGLSSARDLLAAHADESEALARGQATEAEQAQTRAAASATRAAVQRGGVALLDREIAALKGGA